MKKQLFLMLLCVGLTLTIMAQTTTTGKKGGSTSMGNHKADINGTKGGGAKVDKKGVNIKGKNGGGVQLGKKK